MGKPPNPHPKQLNPKNRGSTSNREEVLVVKSQFVARLNSSSIMAIMGQLQRPHCDLTGIMVNKGNHPKMAQLFRLVKYYNLPR